MDNRLAIAMGLRTAHCLRTCLRRRSKCQKKKEQEEENKEKKNKMKERR